MAKTSLKKYAEAMASDCLWGSEIDEVLPNCGAESGPVRKAENGYQFDVTYYGRRGGTSSFRVTIENV